MAETEPYISQEQDTIIRAGLQAFSVFPEWLTIARDPARLFLAFSLSIPEFVSGRLLLHQCDSYYIRYKETYWTGFFKLFISGPGEMDQRLIELQGVLYPPGVLDKRKPLNENAFGSHDWHAVLPSVNLELWTKEPEAALSSLSLLTDPEQSCQYLTTSIQNGSSQYRNLQIQASHPKVVRYKPGSRCTIVYHLDYKEKVAHDHWPDLVVAKTYRKEKGLHAYQSMLSFWNSPLAGSRLMKIAEPLAYDPEMRVMIQGPIYQEKTLKDLTVMAVNAGTQTAYDELRFFMQKTARALSELNASPLTLENSYLWENDMAEVREFIDRLANSIPELGPAGIFLAERLNKIAAKSSPDPLVPSHGTFRPAQVLINHGEIGFIDFDSCCMAEPAKDLGLFLCAFMRAGMATVEFDDIPVAHTLSDVSSRLDRFNRLESISREFLDEYERAFRQVNRERVALFEALEIFTLVLHAWMKVKAKELDDIISLLELFIQRHNLLEEQ